MRRCMWCTADLTRYTPTKDCWSCGNQYWIVRCDERMVGPFPSWDAADRWIQDNAKGADYCAPFMLEPPA